MEFFVSSEVSEVRDLSRELVSILSLPESVFVIWSDKRLSSFSIDLDDVMILFRGDETRDSKSDFFWHRVLKGDIFDSDFFFGLGFDSRCGSGSFCFFGFLVVIVRKRGIGLMRGSVRVGREEDDLICDDLRLVAFHACSVVP
jgi:hypothetical protein